jgi:hypothetical protein
MKEFIAKRKTWTRPPMSINFRVMVHGSFIPCAIIMISAFKTENFEPNY